MLTLLAVVVVIALIFDFINGFHDAANSIATVVSTQVLKPHWAVLWAAFFNFIAFLFFDLRVAGTIGKGVIDPSIVDISVVFAALFGAIVWNLVTWYFGIPASSSHALIGGLAGAGIVAAGFSSLNFGGLMKIGISIVASPLLGLALGWFLMKVTHFLFRKSSPRTVDTSFRRLQLVSAALYSLGHGGNDAQKTMGIIAVLLFTAGQSGPTFHVPFWVVISCQIAMALGTLCGGWRIVRTMGMRLTRLRPIGGFCAETAGALTLFFATGLGIPVSTTHTITGSIVGVGAVNGLGSVRWQVARQIVWAWIFTVPAAAIISAICLVILRHFQ